METLISLFFLLELWAFAVGIPTQEERCLGLSRKAVHSWVWGLNLNQGSDSQEEMDVFRVSCEK